MDIDNIQYLVSIARHVSPISDLVEFFSSFSGQKRIDISTDSGETATFSIDLNRADSPPQENSANLDAADSKDASSVRAATRHPERAADKENRSSRESPASSKKRSGSRTPDKSPSPSEFSQYIRKSLEISPENRPIMGSVAVHWENMHPSLTPKPKITNSTTNYEVHNSPKLQLLLYQCQNLRFDFCTILTLLEAFRSVSPL